MKESCNRLLNQKEVAQLVGMSLAWMEQCRFKRTGIPYLKIGRAVRYKLTDVEQWLDERASHFSDNNAKGGLI